jgi:hypothetical protein
MLKHFILSGLLIAGFSGPAVALEANDSLIQWGQAAQPDRVALAKSLVASLPKPSGREATLADTRLLINCLNDLSISSGGKFTIRSAADECWTLVK